MFSLFFPGRKNKAVFKSDDSDDDTLILQSHSCINAAESRCENLAQNRSQRWWGAPVTNEVKRQRPQRVLASYENGSDVDDISLLVPLEDMACAGDAGGCINETGEHFCGNPDWDACEDHAAAIKKQSKSKPGSNRLRGPLKACCCRCCSCRCCKRCMLVTTAILFVALVASLAYFYACINDGVRLSFGDAPNVIAVTWATGWQVAAPVVVYREVNSAGMPIDGSFGHGIVVSGTSSGFGKSIFTSQYINRVILRNLSFGGRYEYIYGEDASTDDFVNPEASDFEINRFRVPDLEKESVSFATFGDMGAVNMAIMPYLQRDVDAEMYDFVFHIGDFAYDLDSYFGLVGDLFLSNTRSIAAKVPYMVTPGNHESYWDHFNQYMNRFSMPNYSKTKNLWYAFEIGPIKIISISSEAYYTPMPVPISAQDQIQWLIAELGSTNRSRTPWVVTMSHRPMYCSNADSDCDFGKRNRIRVGLEEILFEHNVTVAFWAHEHSYERTCAVYNGVCESLDSSGSARQIYQQPPRQPIHVITGSAGCVEGQEKFTRGRGPWSRVQDTHWGFGRLTANYTTFVWSQHHIINNELTQVDRFEIHQ